MESNYPMSTITQISFLWIKAQLDELQNHTTPAAVEQALSTFSLPQHLVEVYQQSLAKIPKENLNRVSSILRIIAAALRPLTLDEVAEATAIDHENENFDPSMVPREKHDVLLDLSGLVSVTG